MWKEVFSEMNIMYIMNIVRDNELFVIFNLSLTMLKICKIEQKNLHLENRGVKVQTIKFVMHV